MKMQHIYTLFNFLKFVAHILIFFTQTQRYAFDIGKV